jgi:hypothetical protein
LRFGALSFGEVQSYTEARVLERTKLSRRGKNGVISLVE